jgi:hypothetical protein
MVQVYKEETQFSTELPLLEEEEELEIQVMEGVMGVREDLEADQVEVDLLECRWEGGKVIIVVWVTTHRRTVEVGGVELGALVGTQVTPQLVWGAPVWRQR